CVREEPNWGLPKKQRVGNSLDVW
nr:immunoglobulin heavy chain junction region [Macaca mulatta]MOW32374.1 immunoglobulin heavy chain junction region [Macaca mulatta]MOW32504.1 immunoglobulin heavy chain junction region [Macaca mulatta]MOW32581.1 immunoglobulin heavy chain junction region [Macaca mulatta]MOW32686.1 immunoglobulin heavy chain junction region [Macaca mulatta]